MIPPETPENLLAPLGVQALELGCLGVGDRRKGWVLTTVLDSGMGTQCIFNGSGEIRDTGVWHVLGSRATHVSVGPLEESLCWGCVDEWVLEEGPKNRGSPLSMVPLQKASYCPAPFTSSFCSREA